MKKVSLSESGFERKPKKMRKREFIGAINLAVSWEERISLISSQTLAPGGHTPFAFYTMLLIYCVQRRPTLFDLAEEEALSDMALLREVMGSLASEENPPGETTIFQVWHKLEIPNMDHKLLTTKMPRWAARGAAQEWHSGRCQAGRSTELE